MLYGVYRQVDGKWTAWDGPLSYADAVKLAEIRRGERPGAAFDYFTWEVPGERYSDHGEPLEYFTGEEPVYFEDDSTPGMVDDETHYERLNEYHDEQ